MATNLEELAQTVDEELKHLVIRIDDGEAADRSVGCGLAAARREDQAAPA